MVSCRPDVVHQKLFHAVKSESDEGFLIVQCKNIAEYSFEGLTLNKLSDQNVHVLYLLSGMSPLILPSLVLRF